MFGVACEALATYEDVLALLHPEDRQSAEEAIKHCINEHGASELDYRVLRPDGTMCWLYQRSQVYSDRDNVPTHMRGVVLDISKQKKVEGELKTREEHLRSVLEIVPDAMIVIDDRGIIKILQRSGQSTVRVCGIGDYRSERLDAYARTRSQPSR